MRPNKRARSGSNSPDAPSDYSEETLQPSLKQQQKKDTPLENPFLSPLPHSRPSDYLREQCPLCFGGSERFGNDTVLVVF